MAAADYSNIDSSGELVAAGSPINTLNANLEIFFVSIFTLEMVLKLGALGIWNDKDSYFKDPWNWLDCIIVISS